MYSSSLFNAICFLVIQALRKYFYIMPIIIPHCSAQARRRLIHNSARHKAPKLTRAQRTVINERRRDKHDQEDTAVEEVLEYIQNKAMELATRFRRSPRRYLERFYIGSAIRRQKRKKTSAWSAFMHFKGKETNQGQYNFPSYFHNFNVYLYTRQVLRHKR